MTFDVILHHWFSVLTSFDNFFESINFEIVQFYDFEHFNQEECYCESSKHTSS